MSINRSSTTLWDSESITTAAVSNWAQIFGSSVCIFIDNEGGNSHVFRIQVAHGVPGAGRNAADSADADGGFIWYDLQEDDLSATREITVGANANLAVNIGNVGAPYVRLYCVSGTANDVTAVLTSSGPN